MKKILTKILTTAKKKTLIKIINRSLIFVFFSFIVIYAVLNTRLISRGINLVVLGIENGNIYNEGTLPIEGNAKRAKHVLVNGREINVNQSGDFMDMLVLLPGYNIITISAEDKFGKVTQKKFDIVRKDKIINLEG